MLLVDKSGSMGEKLTFNGETTTKSQAVDTIINNFVDELLFRCRRGSNYMDYFEIAIIGYHEDEVYSILDSSPSQKIFFSVSDLVNKDVDRYSITKKRVGADGRFYTHISNVNRWVKTDSGGNTPMLAALNYTYKQLSAWTQKNNHTDTIPPFLIHITDGDATDAEEEMLINVADKIKNLSINKNSPIFMNVNISSMHPESIIFPSSTEDIPKDNRYAKMLYDMSSKLPDEFLEEVKSIKKDPLIPIDFSEVKAMAYNASINELVRILSIGTSTIYG